MVNIKQCLELTSTKSCRNNQVLIVQDIQVFMCLFIQLCFSFALFGNVHLIVNLWISAIVDSVVFSLFLMSHDNTEQLVWPLSTPCSSFLLEMLL